MRVDVRNNDVHQAFRMLKKKMQREGIFREMRSHRAHEKIRAAHQGKAGVA
ncbi:MAG: 30S ribosomal protein S21 [Rhizobiales bacterium]|nr:30S ribosomal protein S21 [Hyphomicrobiales bacterium]